jgi:hypothetical protein
MNKLSLTVASIIVWSATTIAQVPAAQQPPASGGQRQDPAVTQPAPTPSAAKITLQGCVERQGSATGTAGAVGTAGSAGSFILTKAERQPAATAPAAGASAATMTYRLDADSAKLNPHVGHKVEVTGVMEAISGAKPQVGSTQPPSASTTAPTFKVDEVKMLAASCTE